MLFLIHINDLHFSIKFCKVHHFADGTNLINFNSSIKVINKQVNKDLKTLSNWLNANKICLNVSKTELVLFRSAKKQLNFGLKLKLNGKRLYPTNSVKYLRVKIDEHLTWKTQIDRISTKLNKANVILSKVRHFVAFLYINPLNNNFPNHLITGLDFPQIFIPTTHGGQIWAVLMYLLTELNYMEEILFVLVQFSLGIIFKIFI